MILAALAAAVAAVASPAPPGAVTREAPMPNLYHQPDYCPQVVAREVARQQVAMQGLRPMGQYAVLRELNGCSVPTPVGYHPAAQPGAADAPPAGARREDAPSNRR